MVGTFAQVGFLTPYPAAHSHLYSVFKGSDFMGECSCAHVMSITQTHLIKNSLLKSGGSCLLVDFLYEDSWYYQLHMKNIKIVSVLNMNLFSCYYFFVVFNTILHCFPSIFVSGSHVA